jgi:TolA-binding protein
MSCWLAISRFPFLKYLTFSCLKDKAKESKKWGLVVNHEGSIQCLEWTALRSSGVKVERDESELKPLYQQYLDIRSFTNTKLGRWLRTGERDSNQQDPMPTVEIYGKGKRKSSSGSAQPSKIVRVNDPECQECLSLRSQLEKLKRKLNRLEKKNVKATESFETEREKWNDLNDKLKTARTEKRLEVKELKDTIKKLQKDITKLESQVNQANSVKISTQENVLKETETVSASRQTTNNDNGKNIRQIVEQVVGEELAHRMSTHPAITSTFPPNFTIPTFSHPTFSPSTVLIPTILSSSNFSQSPSRVCPDVHHG